MNTKTREDYRQSKAEHLIRKYQSDPKGHREAVTLLVDLYRREIRDWSSFFYRRNYAFRPENSLKDYEGVATTAILMAARKYDCDDEAYFKTFLRYYVRGECLKLVRETGNTLKMPRPKKKQVKPGEGTCEKYSKKKEEREKYKAISFDDVSVEDMQAYDSVRKYRRQHDLDAQRKVALLQEILEGILIESSSAVLKKQAKRVEMLRKHILMGGTKKSFCDATGTHRPTLDASLEAICRRALQERFSIYTGH